MAAGRTPSPKPIDDFEGWLAAFTQPSVIVELLVLVLCVALGWGLVVAIRRALGYRDEKSILFGRRDLDGVLFPLVLLCLGMVARTVLDSLMPVAVLKVAVPVLLSLVVIRSGVKVLQVAFTDAPWVRALEHTISWLAWLAVVLRVCQKS